MLAVQRAPNMASNKSPTDSDPFLPFGYAIGEDSQPPSDPPPEPPSGMPLLTEDDSNLLNSFFSAMTSEQYGMPSFGEGLQGLQYGSGWMDELPPTFVGTTTSFQGQHNPQSGEPSSLGFEGSNTAGAQMPPPPPPPHSNPYGQHVHMNQQQDHHYQLQQHQPQFQRTQVPQQFQQHLEPNNHQQHPNQPYHHSQDVLSAAATLISNNAGKPPARFMNGSAHGAGTRHHVPPVGQIRHQQLEDFKEQGRTDYAHEQIPRGFVDWMNPQQNRQGSRTAVPTEMRWGSDTNFGGSQGYTIGDQKEMESMERQQQKLLSSLEVSKSAASTRPSSPTHAPTQSGPQRKPEAGASHPSTSAVDAQAPPSKRRKSRVTPSGKSPADDGVPGGTSSRSKKKTGDEQKAACASTPTSKATPGGRKRKGAPGADVRPSRETLTEAEKKENHIKSEQRRRGQIKEGFEDLNKLVPGLQGGGFSKSIQLSHAAEWLLTIRQENDALVRHLASLGK